MTSPHRERWALIERLFHEAEALPRAEREGFLRARTSGDAALFAEVMLLLQADATPDPRLDDPGGALARALVDLADEDDEDDAPERFGPYRTIGLLGMGGMGSVYLAERDDVGATAAIKVLRHSGMSEAAAERFLDEQRLLAGLRHPAIAHFYDTGRTDDGTPWFAMEYVAGQALVAYCQERHRSARERVRLFRDVCLAVRFAHEHLIAHGDLKPSNILVTPEGAVKLLDFGVANRVAARASDDVDSPTAPRPGGISPAYAAPEQLTGQPAGVRTDVYSLGVVLYQLLANRVPFDLSPATSAASAQRLLTAPAPPPSTVGKDAGHPKPAASAGDWLDLDAVCRQAMHPQPEARYPTVSALIADLDRFLATRPVGARHAGLLYRAQKFARRRARRIAVAAAVAAGLGIAATSYTLQVREARRETATHAARAARTRDFLLRLLAGDEEDAAPPESLRVSTVIDRGLREAGLLSDEPGLQAELYHLLGGVYRDLGQFDRADSLLRLALEWRRATLEPGHGDIAEALTDLALVHADQGRYESADTLARAALAIAERARTRRGDARAAAYEAMADVQERMGKYREANASLALAAAAAATGEAASRASLVLARANNHYYLGDLDSAEALTRESMALWRTERSEHHPFIGEALINLGAIEQDRAEYAAAESLFRRAATTMADWYGPDHPRTASAVAMIARTFLMRGRHDEAEPLLREALEIREYAYGPSHAKTGLILNELANIAYGRDRYAEAESLFARTLGIYREAYGADHQHVALALSSLSSVHLASRDYARAERTLRDAIDVYSRSLPGDHLNVGIARIKLGRALVRQGRFADGAVESQRGLEIVARDAPAAPWLRSARLDLIAAYEKLGRGDEARRVRQELDAAAAQ